MGVGIMLALSALLIGHNYYSKQLWALSCQLYVETRAITEWSQNLAYMCILQICHFHFYNEIEQMLGVTKKVEVEDLYSAPSWELGIPTRVSKNPEPGETRSYWQTRNLGLGRT